MNGILVINTNNSLSQNSRDSISDAARRWGADYTEVTNYPYKYHPASLKLKAFDICSSYDRILVLDSDTIIRSDAPNIFEVASSPEIYYAIKNTQPSDPPVYQEAGKIISRKEINSIVSVGKILPPELDLDKVVKSLFNSGVTVITRPLHEPILAYAFYLFCGSPLNWWDQVPINLAVFSILGGYEDLGQRWNRQFPVHTKHMDAYIYHYAGNPERYEILKHVNWRA